MGDIKAWVDILQSIGLVFIAIGLIYTSLGVRAVSQTLKKSMER